MNNSTERLFRSIYVWWIIGIYWGFVFLLCAGCALNSQLKLGERIFCAICAIAIACWYSFAYRAGIITNLEGITVRKYIGKSISVPWKEVSAFEIVGSSPFNTSVFIAARLTNGRLLKTQGLVARSAKCNAASRYIKALENQRPI